MSVIHNKDPLTKIENVRILRETDPCFYSVFNRPLEDIEQQTTDINQIFYPARGLRVKETDPASLTVQIEPGYYMTNEATVVQFPQGAAADTLTISLSAPGTIRIDLVYFDISNGTVGVVTGVEASSAVGFAAYFASPVFLPVMPANDGYIPLAYLYVDGAPATIFRDYTAVNLAGHIRDARLAPGADLRPFAMDPAVLKADTPGGNPGASPLIVPSDHQHPLSSPSALPTLLSSATANYTGNPSEPAYEKYARVDHRHPVSPETQGAAIPPDISGGNAGTGPNLIRADHRHGLNIGAGTIRNNVVSGLGVVGTSEFYSRSDHRHKLEGNAILQTERHTLSWLHEGAAKTTPFPLTVRPAFFYVYVAGSSSPGVGNWEKIGWNVWGFYALTDGVYTPGDPAGCCGCADRLDAGACRGTTTTSHFYPAGAVAQDLGWSLLAFSPTLRVTSVSQALGITIAPNLGISTYAMCILSIFGFVDP